MTIAPERLQPTADADAVRSADPGSGAGTAADIQAPVGTPTPAEGPAAQGRRPAWGDETGAQTAEYGIVTLAAVGFAGVLAVILAGADVQGLLLDLVKNALSLG
jgi:hypothetical protein